MTDRDLLNELHDGPFQPFRVKLSNNTAMDVLDANTVVVGSTSAIMPVETVLGGAAGPTATSSNSRR